MADAVAAVPTPAPESALPQPAPAATAPAPAAPTAAEVRKLRLKLADKEVELPEDQVVEIATAKSQVMYEAQKAQRERDAFMEKLKADPEATLKELGLDMDERAAARFAKRLEEEADEETLSPEAKELKALKRQMAEREEADKKTKAEQEKATHQTKVDEAKARLKATVDEAVKVGNLSNSTFVRGLVLEKLRFNQTHGLPIHPTVLAAEARETLTENFQDWIRGLSVEQVWAATEQFPEFRKEFVKRYAALKGAKSTPKPEPKVEPKPANKKRTAAEESRRLAEAFKRGIG